MKVTYRKKFLKELSKLPANVKPNIEQFAFEKVREILSITESGNIEKMQGYKGFYKARFGSYRVGMQLKDERLILRTVKHRKEIYKHFP